MSPCGKRGEASGRAGDAVLDGVLATKSLPAALEAGARAAATLTGARVAAVLPTPGGEPEAEVWYPDKPAVRDRHRPRFLASVQEGRSSDGNPGARRRGRQDPVRVIPLAAAGRRTGSLCLAGRVGTGRLPAAVTRLAGVLGCLLAARHAEQRAAAGHREYQRWFKTMDDQIRVLELERQKFAALVHRSDAEVFVTDRTGLIRWTNATLMSQRPGGPGDGGWIGRRCAAVCSRFAASDGPPECGSCPVERALERNDTVHHEFRRANHAGSRSLLLSAFPIRGPEGRGHEVMVMIQDLSDLETLRRSEARYRLLFERSAKAILMVDPGTGRVVMANPMASRITGFAADQLCGCTLEQLHPAEDWPRLAGHYRAGLAAGHLAPFECRIRTHDGGERIVAVTGTRYDLDGEMREMLEFQDVTETRRVEEALRRAEERLRSVVANAPIVLFAIDENGIFTLSEGQGLELLGLRPGQVVGCSVFEFYAGHRQILDNVRRAMAGEEFMDRVDVGDLRFETWYAPSRDADGRPRGVIGVSNDVTPRRRLEDQLRHAQKMEAIGRLAGGVAHDFNNLLAAIMGHGELLLRRLEPADPQYRHAEAIQRAAARGALLTRQLLAFSRKEVLAPQALDVHLVVAEMEEMLRRLIGEHIELVIALGDKPVYVWADRGQLEQVLMNLAVNARDAMTDGGLLTVEVDGDARGPVRPDGHAREEAWVSILVRDTGSGMDAATAARIFEPFFTTKEQGKGTGLGLSTVYGVVERSGGVIEVDTAPGKGTAFTVFLPRLEARAGTPPDPATAPSVSGTETVLLVEDEAAVRSVAREALEGHGYRVIEARDGVEALEAARRATGALDMLVTDMVMPKMGGRELARRLLAERPGLRVLYVSGYTDDDTVCRGEAADATFLQKPFTMEVFAAKVREILDAEVTGGGGEGPEAHAA